MNQSSVFAPPIVDRLSVRVVVDSHYDKFLPKATHPIVAIEHVGEIPGRQMTTLAGEWGLSLHLESVRDGGAAAQYLLDFGFTPEIINRNFGLLDIDAAKIDGLILSHGHRDHYGGLVGFVNQHRARMKSDLSLYLGGETIFREKWLTARDGKPPVSWGALDRIALTAQHVVPVCCGTPQTLDGPFTTGEIERTSFESVTGGTIVKNEEHFSDAERRGELVLDQHRDEHGTCFIVKGRGLVVISSCGHTGIVNTVRTAMKVANTDKLHAVIGGFHLGMAPPDYISHTVDELEALSPDVVVPMHCTGAPFVDAMRRRMPDRVVGSNVGTRFTFGV